MSNPLGVIAAGHPLTAEVGADVLRDGGNAVDAALAAVLASFACEPLLTGLGAGGYMLVGAPDRDPVLLDFFVEAPGRGFEPGERAELRPISVSFGDAIQVFNIGAASVGAYGTPAGVCEAASRFGRIPLAELVKPATQLARDGVEVTRQQAYVFKILADIVTATAESAALFAPAGSVLEEGDVVRQPELAAALELLGSEGQAPFYTGEIATAIADWIGARGGMLTAEDLAAYRVIDRQPVKVRYRGRDVLTNPPPSAGGILIAHALSLLDGDATRPSVERIVEVMETVQAVRTPEFLAGLDEPGFAERFLAGGPLGSTTHIAVIDQAGWACSVTCSNGSCSGEIVAGTGVHLNNMLGEQDLNPLGFHRHPAGRRLPSMMAPTAVLREGQPELVLGSAGSNRIRSAILQTIVRTIDEGMHAGEAVEAPRAHFEDGVVYAEPGIDTSTLEAAGRAIGRFRERNLFFGGVQAVQRDRRGEFSGGGDPRRGGAALVVAACLLVASLLAGCGLNVSSADLFQLTRTGEGKPLTLLVNDGGTIRCDGGAEKALSDPLLLKARALVTNLDKDAKARLRLAPGAGSVFSYTIRFQAGTISFADTSTERHPELAQAELFALQAARSPCGLGG